MNENKQAFLWPGRSYYREEAERGAEEWIAGGGRGVLTAAARLQLTDRQTPTEQEWRWHAVLGWCVVCVWVCVSVCLFTWVTLDFGKYVSRWLSRVMGVWGGGGCKGNCIPLWGGVVSHWEVGLIPLWGGGVVLLYPSVRRHCISLRRDWTHCEGDPYHTERGIQNPTARRTVSHWEGWLERSVK